MIKTISSILLLLAIVLLSSCNKDNQSSSGVNLFPDGGFEHENTIADHWSISSGNAIIDHTTYYQGGGAFRKSNIGTSDFFHDPISVSSSSQYELSFWYKAHGSIAGIDDLVVDFIQGGNYILGAQGIISTGWDNPVDLDWTFFTKTISFNSDGSAQFYLHSNADSLWIDNLTLIAQ